MTEENRTDLPHDQVAQNQPLGTEQSSAATSPLGMDYNR